MLVPDFTNVCGLARRMNCVPHLLVQGAKRSNVRARHLCTQLRGVYRVRKTCISQLISMV